MLFSIVFWIVVLTVLGILCVGLFRLLCEPELKTEPKDDEGSKLAPESNHYEPLTHELKQMNAVANEERKDSGNAVAEAVLVKIDESGVPKEDKALNTQAIDVPDVSDQVKVSNTTATKASNDVPAADSVVIETQNNEQAPVNSTGSAVPNVPLTTEISSQPVIAKVSSLPVSATISIPEPVSDPKGDDAPPPKLPQSPVPVITTAQPNINEVPTPYNEVENSTLPRVNGVSETVNSVTGVMNERASRIDGPSERNLADIA